MPKVKFRDTFKASPMMVLYSLKPIMFNPSIKAVYASHQFKE
jgi:hypothetical protein